VCHRGNPDALGVACSENHVSHGSVMPV
jgi:hypothetical protein